MPTTINRRQLIGLGGLALASSQVGLAQDEPLEVNDVHSQLNPTRVERIVRPASVGELRASILSAKREGLGVSISGSRHAMGGQQFATGAVLLDMRGLNRVLSFEPENRTIRAEAGIEWPELLGDLASRQVDSPDQLGIFQKQTGADRLTLGGALASNVHGRGLTLKPFINDVESFELMNAEGDLVYCDRNTNSRLFSLAIGGYGLFGVITSVRLKLRSRMKVRRVVRIADTSEVPELFADRIRDGSLYGDYQFATDSTLDSFLHRGVFSCYQPVDASTPLTQNPTRFNPEDWARLTHYSHTHKSIAFQIYTRRYLATSGQIYYHDQQLSAAYHPGYHAVLDRKMHVRHKATEMITEIYVPRSALARFMEEARLRLREQKANLIYGTVRLIEQEHESFLRWATQSWACVIFNLHVIHTPVALAAAADAFRTLIDLGIRHGGTYYLTYHRWATVSQAERCYPQFRDFLAYKLLYDPGEVFRSDWYLHHKNMFHA